MLLLNGDDIEPGTYRERSILDVMPTVLRYMDCPLPTDVDGTVIQEPFKRQLSIDETRPPIEAESRGERADDDNMKDTLKELGYLE
jgi:arylsulfatase A-like enzyme